MTTIADRLAALIRIPSVSTLYETDGTDTFERAVATLAELYPLMHQKLELERIGNLGLLFRWAGSDSSLANHPLVLMAHLDVVPVDLADPWTYPPFDGTIADAKVWGRGALDDKGPLVVICEAVESLLASGFTPVRDVLLSFGGDEEIFGAGAELIADTIRQRGITPYLVLDEGGAIVDAPLKWVKVPAAMVGVGEKGIMTVVLSTQAEPGHSSAPEAMTAVSRIGLAVSKLTASTFPVHLPSATITMLKCFIPHTSGAIHTALTQMVKSPALTGQILARMGGEPAAMARTTVAATMIEGGTAPNVLPSSARAVLNVRIAIGETTDSALARIKHKVGDPKIDVAMAQGSEPSPESPTDNEQFAAIRAAVEATYPGVITAPYVMMAATDGRHFHRFCDAVYRFAPLAMNAAQRATLHGIDEWVEIDSLERGQAFHEHLIRSVASAM